MNESLKTSDEALLVHLKLRAIDINHIQIYASTAEVTEECIWTFHNDPEEACMSYQKSYKLK